MKSTLSGPGGIKLELDSNEIYPNDPGQGTPALVVMPNGNTASYNCAVSEGETMDGDKLSPAQIAWLEKMESTVEQFLNQ